MTVSIFTNQDTWHLIELFLWMLGAFLIGWFFWRWWYKNKCRDEVSAWRSKYDALQNNSKKDDTTMRVKKVAAPGVTNTAGANFVDGVAKVDTSLKSSQKDDTSMKVKKVAASGVTTAAASNFVDGVAKVNDSVKDDLTKVEGIGPKIKGLLNDDDIWSFKQLSETAVSRIEKILDEAGPRYRMHSPTTWPEQAKMAHEGKWDELKQWQANHKGGRAK